MRRWERREHASGELLVAGELQLRGVALWAERRRPGGGGAGDACPGDALAGLDERDVTVVDVEQLAGGRFEVLDQQLDDPVGEARAVEQRGERAQGRVYAELLDCQRSACSAGRLCDARRRRSIASTHAAAWRLPMARRRG